MATVCIKPYKPEHTTPPVTPRGPTLGSLAVDGAAFGKPVTPIEFAAAKQAATFAHAKINRAGSTQEIERLLAEASAILKSALAATRDRREMQSLRARLANLESVADRRLKSIYVKVSSGSAGTGGDANNGPRKTTSGSGRHGQVSVGNKQRAPQGAMQGVVVFVAKAKMTIAELEQFSRYVDAANTARVEGRLSSIGRVSTSGRIRARSNIEALKERFRAERAGTPYAGQVGHAPDATWTGTPTSPEWHDQTPRVNASLGAQAAQYPIGFTPTDFTLGYSWETQ